MQTFTRTDWLHIALVIILRIVSSFAIFWEPFVGLLIANLFDALDVVILSALSTIVTNRQYQILDKLLDNLLLIVMFASIFAFELIPQPYLSIAIFLFIYRITGSILALITKERRILLITPNFFLYYYGFFALLNLTDNYGVLDNLVATNLIIGLLFAFNYAQEIILHFMEFHPWEWVEKRFFKGR